MNKIIQGGYKLETTMEYLKKFDTASDYEAYITGNPSLPNVSLVEGNNIKYNKTRPEQNHS